MFVFRFFISHPVTSAHFRISGPEIASSEVGSIEYFLYPQKHTRLRAMKFAISRNLRNQYNWSQSVANRRSTQWLPETKTSQNFHRSKVSSFASLTTSICFITMTTSREKDHFLRQESVFIVSISRIDEDKAGAVAETFY